MLDDQCAGERTPVALPAIICGERRRPSRVVASAALSGAPTSLAAIDDRLIDELLAQPRDLLVDLPLQEIVAFLNRAGALWKQEEYARRRLFVRRLTDLLGYSEAMAEMEADLLAAVLSGHTRLHDSIAVELGHRLILDRWIPREDCEVRAWPVGLVLHVLPGNVPMSSVVSIVRALLTKNVSIGKVASGDPITALSLALSLRDVDASHPVARAVSVLYWPKGDPLGDRVAAAADGIAVWGGDEALSWAVTKARPDANVLRFGPRRSVALIGRDAEADAAMGVAHDVAAYEQRACFSIHQVFVQRPAGPFIDALQAALDRYESFLPPSRMADDERAGITIERATHDFLGSVVESKGAWATITCSPANVVRLPSARTVFVHEVGDLEEALPWIDASVQTAAVTPQADHVRLRDSLARCGAVRIVEPGLSGTFRLGGTHDGFQPLSQLVRLVSSESPAAVHGKGMVIPLNTTDMLQNRRFQDLVS